MKIRDVMTPDVDVINPAAKVAEASRRMRDENIGALPVGEGDKRVGMVTDRELMVRTLDGDKNPTTATGREAKTDQVPYSLEDQRSEERRVWKEGVNTG